MVGDLIVGLWKEGWTLTESTYVAAGGGGRFRITASNSGLDPKAVFEGSGATESEAIVDLVGKITDHVKTVAAIVMGQKREDESCGAR